MNSKLKYFKLRFNQDLYCTSNMNIDSFDTETVIHLEDLENKDSRDILLSFPRERKLFWQVSSI